ncbi:phosphorylase family protein [Moritella viscosa]|uniref:Putative nucleoside phosphorylase family n=1 Tax=Moritella viscosa TaxID=80854 RepID=A0A1L0AMW3_9GAMM|nr:nucleoside phosphorylase [Moritella viscosa]SGY89112.1 Putative nucleoside phosphorylase family [Moritella viscosa]
MNILILEDNQDKRDALVKVVAELEMEIEYRVCKTFHEFVKEINRNKYDLVVADLMVPLFRDSTDEQDISDRLIEDIRDLQCKNFRTPVIAVTKFDKLAESNFCGLNMYDITVITYDEAVGTWKDPFLRKIESCIPEKSYEFVIVCALDKEADAYLEAGYNVSNSFTLHGVACRTISINSIKGLIVTPTRMGLVNAAILSARSIDLFKPKLICMSGICAGIEGKANIYDVIIPEICHQHDSGKWTAEGFIPELYSVQLHHNTMLKISNIIKGRDFIDTLKDKIIPSRNEYPIGNDLFDFNVYLASTSSGSAVVADDETLGNIKTQHRKMTAFEMESYALYESARQSLESPIFFSAKAVVDNGDSQKGDEYHRIAALISAKTVHEIIKRGIIDS